MAFLAVARGLMATVVAAAMGPAPRRDGVPSPDPSDAPNDSIRRIAFGPGGSGLLAEQSARLDHIHRRRRNGISNPLAEDFPW
jgi:hypothetical protein